MHAHRKTQRNRAGKLSYLYFICRLMDEYMYCLMLKLIFTLDFIQMMEEFHLMYKSIKVDSVPSM